MSAAFPEQASDSPTSFNIIDDKEIMAQCNINWWKSNVIFDTKEQNVFNEIATMIASDIALDDYVENNTTKRLSGFLVQAFGRFSESIHPQGSSANALDALLVIAEALVRYDENKARTAHGTQWTSATQYFHEIASKAFTQAYENSPQFRQTFDLAKAEHKKAVAQYNAHIAAEAISSTASHAKTSAMKFDVPLRPKDDLARFGPLKDGGVFSNLFSILNNPRASPLHVQKASYILSGLLSHGLEASHPAIRMFVQWANVQLDNNTPSALPALMALKNLLKAKSSHMAFSIEEGVASLAKQVSAETKNMQVVYSAGFCLWLVSFNDLFDEQIHNAHVVAKISNLLRVVAREKITRIGLLLLTNLLNRSDFSAEMIGADILKILSTLKQRKMADTDIDKMVAEIENTIRVKISELSSFDKYIAELNAGALRKSPVHSEKFWSQNSVKFEDNNYALIKAIIAQLASENKESVEMACFDLGEFARFHPEGKKILAGDAKNKLMIHMSNKDPVIAKAALLAVQKLLIQKWESVAMSVKNSK